MLPSSPPLPLLFPQSSSFYQARSCGERDPEGSGGSGDRALPLRQQLGGDNTREAAWEVSHGGHPFSSSCPITTAHSALFFAQELGTHQKKLKTFPFTQVKDAFGDKLRKWSSEGLRREIQHLWVLKSYPYVAIPVINKNELFFTLVAQWLSLSANFNHWSIPPMLFPYYPSFKNASL